MKVALVLLVLAYAYQSEAGYTCSIAKGEKLTPVNGKGVKLDIPCKFNAIRQKCGKWTVRLSPGMIFVPPRFILDTVWLGVDSDLGNWEGRTSNKIATKFINDMGDVRVPFIQKSKSGPDTDAVLTFSHSDKDVTATAIDGAFSVTFGPYDVTGSKHRNVGLTFTCNSDSDEPVALPGTICGGTDKKELENFAESKGFDAKKEKELAYLYAVTTDLSTDQTPNPLCRAIQEEMVYNCTEEQRVEATRLCEPIFYSKPHRACVNKFNCDLTEVYYNCVRTVCGGFERGEACDALGEAIDLCREFPGLSDGVRKCYKGLFHPIEMESVAYKQ